MKLKIPLLTLLLLISLTGIAGWLGESSIKGAFGITLGEVTKSNKKRSIMLSIIKEKSRASRITS